MGAAKSCTATCQHPIPEGASRRERAMCKRTSHCPGEDWEREKGLQDNRGVDWVLLKCAAAHKGNPFATGYHIIHMRKEPAPAPPHLTAHGGLTDRRMTTARRSVCSCSLASVYLPGNSSHKLIGVRGECLRNVCEMFAKCQAKELRVAPEWLCRCAST